MYLQSEIAYREDTTALFEPLAEEPWAVYLDSGRPSCTKGRFDILTARPYLTLITRGAVTEIRSAESASLSDRDPFELLREALGPPQAPAPHLPFCGGAIGYLAYDLGRRIERLPELSEDAEAIPDMAIGIYDWALVVDHLIKRAWLVGGARDRGTEARWRTILSMFEQPPRAESRQAFRVLGPVRSNLTQTQYVEACARVKSYIREGDCYQVNLSQRFSAPARGDSYRLYSQLRRLNPAPYGAYLRTPFVDVLSTSPERFLALHGGQVETRPIKGTRPRGQDPAADDALREALAASIKDRAENLMIVDLLRNDLGRVCAPGSVQVPRLFEVETYATVHHLVSTVTGRLAAGEDAASLLRACFPGGSVTGAPKIRAMQIIEELEPHRRGIYSGSILYWGFDGSMDSSITIRTMVYSSKNIRFWAGGGIVHDSSIEEEYRETLHKAAALLEVLRRSGPSE